MRFPFLFSSLLSIAIVCMSFGVYSFQNYEISDDYAIKFSTNGAKGTFSDLMGTVAFDPENLDGSKFDVSVSTASIETGNKTQNKHARGDSWLNAEANPRISFVSSAFAKTNGGYAVTGSLTINGVTKTVNIPFLFEESTFTGALTVAREDYGIDGPFLVGGLVGDEVEVSLRVPVQ